MLTQHIYRPTMQSGVVYARVRGSAAPMQTMGGLSELAIAVKETVIKQKDHSRPGGGNRGQVNRIDEVTFSAKLQDLNPINFARAVFGSWESKTSGTTSDEAHKAYKGGLIPLENLNPSAVTLTTAGGSPTTIAAAGNYEVRPEGLFIFDDAPGITTDGMDVLVDYTYGAHEVIQALVNAAPKLEMRYAGVNEAMSGLTGNLDVFNVQLGAAKKIGLIDTKDFAELELEGEILSDPTKTGAGLSRFFVMRMQTPV